MILERIAIDFRCRGCSTVCRLEAALDKTVADQMPSGWVLENMGASCTKCAGGPEPSVKERAEERREAIRKIQTAQITSLESPVTVTASPLTNDKCTRCKLDIGEMESWRPDTLATGFAKAHRACLDKALWSGQ